MAYIGISWCFFAFPYLLQARRSKQEGKRERGTKGNGRTREERTSVESKRGVQGLKERAKAGFAAPDAPAQCSHSRERRDNAKLLARHNPKLESYQPTGQAWRNSPGWQYDGRRSTSALRNSRALLS